MELLGERVATEVAVDEEEYFLLPWKEGRREKSSRLVALFG